MLGRRFIPFISAKNFKGVNAKDTSENMVEGEWHKDSINVFSDPEGAIGSRPGYTSLTTASIGSNTAWCGFYMFETASLGSRTSYYIGGGENGKVYRFSTNQYIELYGTLSTALADDKRYDFFTVNNKVTITTNDELPLIYTGTGSATTAASAVTADFGIAWQRRGWLHSTVDDRLVYYQDTLDDATAEYTSFLNFDLTAGAVTGIARLGDDLLVGKLNGLFRVQYRGTAPLYKIYEMDAEIGPETHFTMKRLPDGSVVFLGSDQNFYRVLGNATVPVGDNIKPYIKNGVKARMKYAVSGLLKDRDQYWCSFTYTSGATQNDRTVVMDWSRPYRDAWGKLQYPWFIYSIGANCFAEVIVNGSQLLYHGGYVGKMYRDDNGTNDDGAAFNSTWKDAIRSQGDLTLEKKYANIEFSYQYKGAWNLNISFIIDENAGTEKIVSEEMSGGVGVQSLYDVAKYDEDYYSQETDSYVSRDIDRVGKKIQTSMGTTGLDEAWLVYYFTIHAKGLRRSSRKRET